MNLAEPPSPIHNTQQRFALFDATTYQESETLVINLDAHIPIKSTIAIPVGTHVIIGSAHCNNVIIGNSHTLIVIHQNQGNNLLIPGKENVLVLNKNSRSHIVIRPDQGIIKIFGFSQQDVLHIIDGRTIYSNSQFICRELNHQPNSLTLLQFRGTEVQLTNTNCETIAEQIRFNNQTALEEAQTDVFQAYANQDTLLYQSLLNMCETFLNSVSKSALLTAVPKFVTELLYHLGGIPRHEAEASGREMQLIVTVSLAGSNTAITASFLAGWLTSQLTQSPKIISMVSMGASIVMSVAETLWTQDASFAVIALQTGVAMMGASLGSAAVEKAEQITGELATWSWNKACKMQAYAKDYFGFWKKEKEPTAHVDELLLPLAYCASQRI